MMDTSSRHSEHNDSSDHHTIMMADFKKRFIVSIILTIPILFLSPLIQQFFGFEITFAWSKYVLFFFSSCIFFYGGWPFLKGIYSELKEKSPGMMTLIAVAISVAYFYSSAVVFGLQGKFFFWELATLVDVMLIGHYIEMKSIIGASRSLERLAELMPDIAHRKRNGSEEDVTVDQLEQGDIVLIRPGEKIPSDGEIVKGRSSVNEAMLTGESTPVPKNTGDAVIGGSINGEGALEIKVEKTGEDTYLSKVITMVNNAQKSKSKTQRFADKAAFYLTVIALSVGLVTFFTWLLLGKNFVFSIERMATVMVITCPHALGLAIPLVVALSTTLSAQHGLLIRNRTSFENARRITTVLFDKTGTLTEGTFQLTKSISVTDDYDEQHIIRLAASLEKNSEHPLAKGILTKAEQIGGSLFDVSDFQNITGQGVKGVINGDLVSVVGSGYIKERDIEVPGIDEISDSEETSVFVVMNERVIGMLQLTDVIRKESFEAVKQLQQGGVKCWMVTGDSDGIAKKVSDELGLDGYYAEVLPDEKLQKVIELQKNGEIVAMTGDGVNDAPALAQADVGIAIGSGTDVAAETADIVLVNSNPQDVTHLIEFGKATYKKMIQNLFWATGYNVFAIPLAAGVLYPEGILISPAVGAALMSVSTIIVALNAKLLRY
jgi:Cu2+-exporting ATPase